MFRSEKEDFSRLDFGAREILSGEESPIGQFLALGAGNGLGLSQNKGVILGISGNIAPKTTPKTGLRSVHEFELFHE